MCGPWHSMHARVNWAFSFHVLRLENGKPWRPCDLIWAIPTDQARKFDGGTREWLTFWRPLVTAILKCDHVELLLGWVGVSTICGLSTGNCTMIFTSLKFLRSRTSQEFSLQLRTHILRIQAENHTWSFYIMGWVRNTPAMFWRCHFYYRMLRKVFSSR